MREQFERTIGDIASSPLRIAIVAVCFGLSAGLLGYIIHIFVMRMNVSPQAQTGIEFSLLCCAAALAPFLLLTAARERRRRVVDDLRRIAQLNHEVRNALQVIVFGEYESAATPAAHRTAILGSVEQIDKTLRQLFPVIGDRTDDQRRVRHIKINNVSAFVPNRRHQTRLLTCSAAASDRRDPAQWAVHTILPQMNAYRVIRLPISYIPLIAPVVTIHADLEVLLAKTIPTAFRC
jgi:hypothetical protein